MTEPLARGEGRNGRWVKLGTVTVDSASMCINDPAFVPEKKAQARMPSGVLSAPYGCFDAGVQFWAGFGDGYYDVWGWVADYAEEGQAPDERIAQVTMVLITQEELDQWREMESQ